MSLADKLQQLVTYQNSIRTALQNKGAAVTSSDNLSTFPTIIDNMTVGGGGSSSDNPSPEEIMNSGWAPYYSQLSNVTQIPRYAFGLQPSISGVAASFPNCKTLGDMAFYGTNITEAYFPVCRTAESSVFFMCREMSKVYFPLLESVGANFFAYCSALSYAYFPLLKSAGGSTFASCSNIKTVVIPKIPSVPQYLVRSLSKIETVYCVSAASTGTSAFAGCTNLKSVYWLSTAVGTLYNSSVFLNSPNASIFVRASLLDGYKTKANWTYFSSRIFGLTDEEIEEVKTRLEVFE